MNQGPSGSGHQGMLATNRRIDPLRQTLAAPARTAVLAARTARAPLSATLPVDLASNEALKALRDEVLADIYSSLLEPA